MELRRVHFRSFRLFDISGHKYTDVNGNGVVDVGDNGLGGVTIFIDVNNDGDYDVGTDLATTTAGDGSWSFTNLGVGYAGKKGYEGLPNDTVPTPGNAGYTITGTSGTDQTNLNFANFQNMNISGYKWADGDHSGTWNEPATAVLSGWTIVLDGDNNPNNGWIATTTTDANGHYAFSNLNPTSY